jgi:aryl-alcohol dehydrogenase-like predicted oxidoreductase
MDESSFPEKLAPLKTYIQKIKAYCKNESINLFTLALSYAVYNEHIDNVLVGVDTKEQLLQNIESIINLKYAFNYINQHIHVTETELLNPVNWK